jgi:hypothetical protein
MDHTRNFWKDVRKTLGMKRITFLPIYLETRSPVSLALNPFWDNMNARKMNNQTKKECLLGVVVALLTEYHTYGNACLRSRVH